MNIINALLAELEQEAQATERVLKVVPQAHLSWRPHPKSYSLGQLALHVATTPGNVAQLAATDTVSTPPTGAQAEAATAAELVPTMKASIARARELLGGFDDAAMTATWRMMVGGNEIMAMPRAALVRMVMLNHWYHHRGQLLVYLRMHNVPLPSVYGPTADENPFAG
ncbi:MAG: DinB family protein [Gemmatimonadaceae bacterium]|nr:DinB family protein [Gemmatimonadaceae bacterium]